MTDDDRHYYDEDRRSLRKERKRASAKDRSRYKKSDQDQLKKQGTDVSQYAHLKRGRVLAITPETILVDHEGVPYRCTLKGALKQEHTRLKTLITVGDFVRFESREEEEGTIAHIEERSSVLSRADHLSQRKEQLIAANVDQVLIICSVVLPPLKPPLVDRYLIAAKKGGLHSVIVINKIDLFASPPSLIDRETLAAEKELYEQLVEIYNDLDIPVYPVSSETGEGIPALKAAMLGKTSVFSGQSGVGKSSLINAVCGSQLRIGEIIARTSKGTHTTTATHLIPLEGGGFCVDTPGIRSFGIWGIEQDELKAYFSEIQEESAHCRFPDCTHLQEPDCAVKKSVAEGRISSLRYDSYCALMETLSQEHKPR